MWQAPNQNRVGAIQNAKKKKQQENQRPFRLRRVRAEVRLIPHHETFAQAESTGTIGEAVEVRVILNDLSAKGIGIYASQPLLPGNNIRVTLEEPRRVSVQGKIVWCQDQDLGNRIISNETYRYRVGVKFVFTSPEEQAAFGKFIAELQKNYLYTPDDPAM